MLLEIIISVFGFILTILGTLLLTYFKEMKQDVGTMSQSMGEMNLKLTKVITDQTWHNKQIEEVKERLHDLEHKS